jgi:hypothetical protein
MTKATSSDKLLKKAFFSFLIIHHWNLHIIFNCKFDRFLITRVNVADNAHSGVGGEKSFDVFNGFGCAVSDFSFLHELALQQTFHPTFYETNKIHCVVFEFCRFQPLTCQSVCSRPVNNCMPFLRDIFQCPAGSNIF